MNENLICSECGETDPVKLCPAEVRVYAYGYPSGRIQSRKCHTCGHVWLYDDAETDRVIDSESKNG